MARRLLAAGHVRKTAAGRFEFECADDQTWSLVKNAVLNGMLVRMSNDFTVDKIVMVDSPMSKRSDGGGVEMELRKNSDGSPVIPRPRPQLMGRFIKSLSPSTADNDAGAGDARAANLKRVKQLARYLTVDPEDAETIAEMRSLLTLLGPDGKEVSNATEAGKPESLFDHAARTAGMNWLEKKAAADHQFRVAATYSRNHPLVWHR
jgi:hypothetical protein